jgi:tetratricopeptide (TPR) repeat protein
VKTNPRNLTARIVLARGLMMRNDLLQAASILSELLTAAPDNADVHAAMGFLQLLKKDRTYARKEFERAFVLDEFQLEAVAGLSTLDVSSGRGDDARARLEGLIARAPQNTGLALAAARVFSSMKEFKRSEELLVNAIDLNSTLLVAYSMLGQMYVSQGRLDEGRQRFQQLADRERRGIGGLTMVGVIEQMQKQDAAARGTFERVMQLDARAPVAANNLAWMYVQSNENLDMALQLAQTAKSGLPQSPDVDDTLGWVYYRKGLLPQAITALSRSVELQPSNPSYQLHLGLAYAKSGDKPRARRALETALKLDPAFDGAAEATAAIATLHESRDIADGRLK